MNPQVTEKERLSLARILKQKQNLIAEIDYLLKQLFEVKAQEKSWWRIVSKRHTLPHGVRHMVNSLGHLLPLKRKEDYDRAIL